MNGAQLVGDKLPLRHHLARGRISTGACPRDAGESNDTVINSACFGVDPSRRVEPVL